MNADVSGQIYRKKRYTVPLPPSPITLLSQEEMVRRIEAFRVREATRTTCPACGTALRWVRWGRTS